MIGLITYTPGVLADVGNNNSYDTGSSDSSGDSGDLIWIFYIIFLFFLINLYKFFIVNKTNILL